MGSPLRGRGLFVLDRNEGLVSPFGSGPMVTSWLDLTPLSAASPWVPCPTSAGWGFVPRSVARLAPSYRVVLTVAEGRGRFLVLSIVLPWP